MIARCQENQWLIFVLVDLWHSFGRSDNHKHRVFSSGRAIAADATGSHWPTLGRIAATLAIMTQFENQNEFHAL